MSADSLIQGFGTAFALLIPIGVQNAFVLRQGIRRQYVFSSAFICFFLDFLLITAGIAGMGRLLTSNPLLMGVARYGGAAFLIYFGWRSAKRALTGQSMQVNTAEESWTSYRRFIIHLAALSLLNPHVYLDTVLLIGSIGGQLSSTDRTFFNIGAVTASAVWFFALAYGARLLTPLFKKPLAWKILDILVALIVWGIAASLLFGDLVPHS